MISVAIPSWNGLEHLKICLPALEAQISVDEPWEILIHDNHSTDGTKDWLVTNHPTVKCLTSPRNLGFAASVNALFEEAKGEIVVLLNNDTLPAETWLASLIRSLRESPADVAAVSGKLLSWDGERLDFGGGIMTFDGHAFQKHQGKPLAQTDHTQHKELLFPCGASMAIYKRAFHQVGGLEPSYFAYFEDVDLGWRLWSAGFRVLYCPDSIARHRGGATTVKFGLHRRGFLFERNALLTVMRNFDEEFWPRMMPSILLTFQSRVTTMHKCHNFGANFLLKDPYQNGSISWLASFGRWLKRHLGLNEMGILHDPLTINQMRAQASFLESLDRTMSQRQEVQSKRIVPDRDIFERFPLYIIPTYPGDQALFRSNGFQQCLPSEVSFVRAELDDILDLNVT